MDDPDRPVKFKKINKLFIERARLFVQRKRLNQDSIEYKNLSERITEINQETTSIMLNE
jgi:hypothetical protein